MGTSPTFIAERVGGGAQQPLTGDALVHLIFGVMLNVVAIATWVTGLFA